MIPTGRAPFWTLQLLGWGGMLVLNVSLQLLEGAEMGTLLFNGLSTALVGISITAAFRYWMQRVEWQKWSAGSVSLLVLASALLMAFVSMLIISLLCKLLVGRWLFLMEFLGSGAIFLFLLLFWCAAYFGIHYFNNWQRSEVERWQLLAEVRAAELGYLKSQLDPHFTFNVLNNIRSLILENKHKAREMLLSFSDLLRYGLANSGQDRIPLLEELAMVEDYLALLSIQYEEKLRYRIDVASGVGSAELPPLILQLLVENAVKHGISRLPGGGEVIISAQIEGNYLHLRVRNTGTLSGDQALGGHHGVGLANVRERLRLLYGDAARLTLRECSPWVEAHVQIPRP